MKLSQDFQDLLAALEGSRVRYLLIGGYAVSIHSKPRATKDIDLWIDSTETNIERLASALHAFGAPREVAQHLRQSGDDEIVWFGNPPSRVDLMRRVPGASFDEAYGARAMVALGDLKLSVISLEHLIKIKEAAGRPQDLSDVAILREHQCDSQ